MPPYANLMNQLYRYKDNIDNLINQYGQTAQSPVQNIINTGGNASDNDIKFIGENDDINNIIVTKKTVFIDEKNAKISIKETDGTISKSYNIIIPKDEKDLKIEELENKLKELEEKINDKHAESTISTVNVKPTTSSSVKPINTTTKAIF